MYLGAQYLPRHPSSSTVCPLSKLNRSTLEYPKNIIHNFIEFINLLHRI